MSLDLDSIDYGELANRLLFHAASRFASAALPLTTKGDLLAFSTLDVRLPVGSNNQVLTADSTQATGVKWAAAGGSTPTLAKGGLITHSTVDVALPVGSDGQVLTADSAQTDGVKWATPSGGGVAVGDSPTWTGNHNFTPASGIGATFTAPGFNVLAAKFLNANGTNNAAAYFGDVGSNWSLTIGSAAAGADAYIVAGLGSQLFLGAGGLAGANGVIRIDTGGHVFIKAPATGNLQTLTLAPSPAAGELIATSAALTDGAGAGAGTLGTAPTAGDPTKWIKINDNGTIRSIPAW